MHKQKTKKQQNEFKKLKNKTKKLNSENIQTNKQSPKQKIMIAAQKTNKQQTNNHTSFNILTLQKHKQTKGTITTINKIKKNELI